MLIICKFLPLPTFVSGACFCLCKPEDASGYDNLKEEDQQRVKVLFDALREGDTNAIAGIKRPAGEATDDLQEAVKNQGEFAYVKYFES